MTTTAIDGSHDQAALAQRLATAVALRNDGKGWQEVADAVGYRSRGAACRAVLTYLGREVAANVDVLRTEANQRHASKVALLEEVMYDPEATWADRVRAADAHTRAEARHARLNGMDAPVQVQLSAGIQAELSDALEELAEVMELRPNAEGVHTYPDDQDGEGAVSAVVQV